MCVCNCAQCKILDEWWSVQDSLAFIDVYGGDGPITYYKYPGDDEKEIAHQRGMKAGLEFKYNEIRGHKEM